PDVVAIPGWYSPASLASLQWSIERAVPRVLMSESTAWDHKRLWIKERMKSYLLRSFSAAFVGGSPHADYLAQLGFPRNNITTGYDVVDNGYFAQGAARVKANQAVERAKRGLPNNYFLASARFVPIKNLLALIRAYAQYRTLTSGTPWSLVLLGSGPLFSEIQKEVEACCVQDHVLFPGFIHYDELPAYYGLANAFVHASRVEPWGLVVNEAMASGLPVLVSDRCGCSADLVQEGENGFTFEPSNTEQLAQLMVRIESNPSASLGAASQRIISDWGSHRFGTGLRTAAQLAISAAALKPGMLTSAVMRMLSLGPT
ncbi:MAG: glycosyltransferase, partial [Aureliella sp.]